MAVTDQTVQCNCRPIAESIELKEACSSVHAGESSMSLRPSKCGACEFARAAECLVIDDQTDSGTYRVDVNVSFLVK